MKYQSTVSFLGAKIAYAILCFLGAPGRRKAYFGRARGSCANFVLRPGGGGGWEALRAAAAAASPQRPRGCTPCSLQPALLLYCGDADAAGGGPGPRGPEPTQPKPPRLLASSPCRFWCWFYITRHPLAQAARSSSSSPLPSSENPQELWF
jgi:hypothetical protein